MAIRITTALFSAALLIAACGKSEEKPTAQPVPEGAKTEGAAPATPAGAGPGAAVAAVNESAPNAVVEILEFSDFQCPFCSRVNPTLKELKTTYGDKLKVVQDKKKVDLAAVKVGAQVGVAGARDGEATTARLLRIG